MKHLALLGLGLTLALTSISAEDYSSTVQRLRVTIPNSPFMDFLYDVKAKKLVGFEFLQPGTTQWMQITGDGTIEVSAGPPRMVFSLGNDGVPGKDMVSFWMNAGENRGAYVLKPNGNVDYFVSVTQIESNCGTWKAYGANDRTLAKANSSTLDGDYLWEGTQMHLVIKGSLFQMSMDGRTYGSGTVSREGDQVIINDQKSIVVFGIQPDGSLVTETYGLSGIWKKVNP